MKTFLDILGRMAVVGAAIAAGAFALTASSAIAAENGRKTAQREAQAEAADQRSSERTQQRRDAGAQRERVSPANDELVRRRDTEADADALLDEDLIGDPKTLAELQRRAEAAEPAGAHDRQLAQFLYKRGTAALAVSRPQQAIADIERALKLDNSSGALNRNNALYDLAQAKSQMGRKLEAANLVTEAIVSEDNRDRLVARSAHLVRLYIAGGDLKAADAALRKIEQIVRLANNRGRYERSLARSQAALLQAQGQYAQAEALWRKSIATRKDPSAIATERRNLAENLRLQGRLAEAETELRTALVGIQAKFGVKAKRTAGTLVALARVLNDEGRAKDAETLVRRSIDIMRDEQLSSGTGSLAVLADVLVAQYRWAEARAEFDEMRNAFRKDIERFELTARTNPNYALSLLKTGATDEAYERLTVLFEEKRKALGDSHYATAEAEGFLAAALAAANRRDEALKRFARAAPILITALGEQDGDIGNRTRDQRLRLILEANIAAILAGSAEADGGRAADTFRLAEAARGRDTLRALAASAARAAADTARLATSARKEQDLQQQISALGGLLADATSARAADRDEKAIAELRDKIRVLRRERENLVKTIAEDFPEYGRLLNPQPATVTDVQKRLKPGEALLAFYSAEDRVYTWAIAHSGAVAVSMAPIGRLDLEAKVKALRRGLDFEAASLDDVPAFDVASAHELFRALLEPTRQAWQGAKILFAVPHGPLGSLPLHLLPIEAPPAIAATSPTGSVPFAGYRDVSWLARHVAIAQLPSTSALLTLRALPRRDVPRRAFVAFGDPLFSQEQASAPVQVASVTQRGLARRSAPASSDYSARLSDLPRLPDTADEVMSIAKAVEADLSQDVFLQEKASESTVRALDLTKWRVVMFATHGLVPGELSGLDQPALALSAPEITGESGQGLLTMDRIMRLRLNADWVVLSACNTAAGDGIGSEAVSGLGRAFFYAGARALLVTNWPVETVSARQLTTELFRSQAADPALTRAEALHRAMLHLIDQPGPGGGTGREQFSYAHPAFWAPFSLIGDGS